MFEQMGKSCPAGFFIFRSDVIPYVHRNDRRLMVLVDKNSKTVIKREFFVRNIDVRNHTFGLRFHL